MTDALEQRIEKGRAWLAEHDSDPPGRFYLWWAMRLQPTGAWPQQPADVVERYRVWHQGFEAWLRLYCQLDEGSDVTVLKQDLRNNARKPHLQQELT
jgi:hypothetical protein